MSRKICVVTGTRAEFGLLRGLMDELVRAGDVELQVIATGMHLSPEFGMTFREIEEAGFRIDAKVEMLLSADTATALTKSMGVGLIGMADALARLAPDVVVLLGDRFEIFVAAAAALVAGVPVAHIHGGETTEGAFDEAFRHSVTKMSHLHFVAADDYRRRVIQLGEAPERVFLVGALGVDAILRTPFLDRQALEASLDFRFGARNLLVTFHPVTLEGHSSAQQVAELLAALDQWPDVHLIFTMPNADTGGRELASMVHSFVGRRPNARGFASLGQQRYLSCMKLVDGVVGNSSSGILEAPTLRVGTVNIGDRQRGRLQASSVINCGPERRSIAQALDTLFSPEYRERLSHTVSPYGSGGAARRIAEVLRAHPLGSLLKKSFHDLAVGGVSGGISP